MTIKSQIAALNDAFRANPFGCFGTCNQALITPGIMALPPIDRAAIVVKVMTFRAFTPDNDPHGEHDFGSFTHNGVKVFWKIDYYAPDMMHASDDPTDTTKTVRVLTVMKADEY